MLIHVTRLNLGGACCCPTSVGSVLHGVSRPLPRVTAQAGCRFHDRYLEGRRDADSTQDADGAQSHGRILEAGLRAEPQEAAAAAAQTSTHYRPRSWAGVWWWSRNLLVTLCCDRSFILLPAVLASARPESEPSTLHSSQTTGANAMCRVTSLPRLQQPCAPADGDCAQEAHWVDYVCPRRDVGRPHRTLRQ